MRLINTVLPLLALLAIFGSPAPAYFPGSPAHTTRDLSDSSSAGLILQPLRASVACGGRPQAMSVLSQRRSSSKWTGRTVARQTSSWVRGHSAGKAIARHYHPHADEFFVHRGTGLASLGRAIFV